MILLRVSECGRRCRRPHSRHLAYAARWRGYGLQNPLKASCRAATLAKPSADTADLIPPNWFASAETVCSWQMGSPETPASGIVLPLSENVMLNVGPVAPAASMMSVPIRSQSGARGALRIQACRSGLIGGGDT